LSQQLSRPSARHFKIAEAAPPLKTDHKLFSTPDAYKSTTQAEAQANPGPSKADFPKDGHTLSLAVT